MTREEAIDVLKCNYPSSCFEELCKAVDIAIKALSAQERKRGRWILKSTNGEMFDCCSECGFVEWDAPRNFCPNCGADMRGEEE